MRGLLNGTWGLRIKMNFEKLRQAVYQFVELEFIDRLEAQSWIDGLNSIEEEAEKDGR